jgi:nucleoside-diphosphate-sugar epimerase
MNKKALVCGAGGFIGSHLVKLLKEYGYYVVGVDLKFPEFSPTAADKFWLFDLRDYSSCKSLFDYGSYDEVYQLAADMGGAQFIFSGEHDADVMRNSAQINLNLAKLCSDYKVGKLFYSSSACCYNHTLQVDPNNLGLKESYAYPAWPDSEYGWEKLFSERLYLSYMRNYGLNVRIARFHNIYGPEGSYNNGKEKAPAAICRKVAETPNGQIDIFGDGNQTRSFLYIDECLKGIMLLMKSDVNIPINIGSNEMVSINQLVQYVAEIAQKDITINHINGPLGVMGRNSDNSLIKEKLGWEPNYPLKKGLFTTYNWIQSQVNKYKE